VLTKEFQIKLFKNKLISSATAFLERVYRETSPQPTLFIYLFIYLFFQLLSDHS